MDLSRPIGHDRAMLPWEDRMPRLLAALAVVPVLAVAPAVADIGNYRPCMEFCTKEHPFAHCHRTCSGEAAGTPPAAHTGPRETPAAETEPRQSQPATTGIVIGDDCSTGKLKVKALQDYIWKTYDPLDQVILGVRDDKDAFTVGFSQHKKKRFCEPTVKVTDDCRVTGFDKLNCRFATE